MSPWTRRWIATCRLARAGRSRTIGGTGFTDPRRPAWSMTPPTAPPVSKHVLSDTATVCRRAHRPTGCQVRGGAAVVLRPVDAPSRWGAKSGKVVEATGHDPVSLTRTHVRFNPSAPEAAQATARTLTLRRRLPERARWRAQSPPTSTLGSRAAIQRSCHPIGPQASPRHEGARRGGRPGVSAGRRGCSRRPPRLARGRCARSLPFADCSADPGPRYDYPHNPLHGPAVHRLIFPKKEKAISKFPPTSFCL